MRLNHNELEKIYNLNHTVGYSKINCLTKMCYNIADTEEEKALLTYFCDDTYLQDEAEKIYNYFTLKSFILSYGIQFIEDFKNYSFKLYNLKSTKYKKKNYTLKFDIGVKVLLNNKSIDLLEFLDSTIKNWNWKIFFKKYLTVYI